MSSPSNDRWPIVVAYQWVLRITSTCLEMIVPGLVGCWIDRKLGTRVLFTVLGFALGMTIGIWQLIRMTGAASTRRGERTEGTSDRS